MSSPARDTIRGLTGCFGLVDLDIGITTTQVETNTAVTVMVDGRIATLATNAAITLTACAEQAVSTTCLYLLCATEGGTFTLVKGREVLTDDLDEGVDVLEYPEPYAGSCAVGVIQIATNASTTFTAGTTDLANAGITDVYSDLGSVPATAETAALT